MFFCSQYHYIPEPSTTFPDWVGVPGSPYASDQALQSLEDASGSISSFEREIDGINLDGANHWRPDATIDWQLVFNAALPFAPAADSLTDETSSNADTLNHLLSPVSDDTLVDSPAASLLPDFKLPPSEDVLVDHQVASFPSSYLDFGFTFQPEHTAHVPISGMNGVVLGLNLGYSNNHGQYCWPEQLPSQHEVGAADAVVPGLPTAMGMNVNEFMFTPIAPTSPSSCPDAFPEHQQDSTVVEEEKPSHPTRGKRCRDSDGDDDYSDSAGDSHREDSVGPKRKRKQQDTTKRIPCPNCPKMFARTHNMKVHNNSVHLGLRSYCCTEPGCDRAFSRKHDLDRHHQSAHTELGSPRNPQNNGGKGAKDKKNVEKDEKDEKDA